MKEKILFVTDAWFPQTNGVVTTISHLYEELKDQYDITIIDPSLFEQVPVFFYPEISLAIPKKIWKKIDKIEPDYIHIFTEGPLGIAAKAYCLKNNLKHTTSFHTNFPLLLSQSLYFPEDLTWEMTKAFHATSSGVLVTNQGMRDVLIEKGFEDNMAVWSRGVDRKKFFYKEKTKTNNPLSILCVSRVSKEKNIKDFCLLSETTDFTYTLVGDGPKLNSFKNKFKSVYYEGKIPGSELHPYYHNADAFFFPSRFDTFGVVMIESFACGTPVVAYNEVAPKGLITPGVNGYIVDNVHEVPEALMEASKLSRKRVYESSRQFSWENVSNIFVSEIVKIR